MHSEDTPERCARSRRVPWVALLRATCLALALLRFGVPPLALASEADGAIRGRLVNLTADGGSVAGLEVTLTAYSGTAEKGQKTTAAGQEGTFVFDKLDTAPELTYQLSVQYQGVPYYSEPVTFAPDSLEQTVELQVFEATTAGDVVTSPARHYLVEPDASGIAVSEIVIVRNSSDRTYVGSRDAHPGARETLRFTLPADAQDVEYGSGLLASWVIPIDGGFIDTMPVYPGDTQRIYRYRIPAQGGKASFSTTLSMATQKVNVLVPDTGVGVSVSNLPTRTNPTIQGERFLVFSGENLDVGTELQFSFDRLPTTQQRSDMSALPLLAGGTALVAVVGAAVLLRRRRSRLSSEPGAAGVAREEGDVAWGPLADEEDLEAERRELVEAIAHLDDAFEAGEIGSEEYGRLRAERKRRLVDVVRRQRSLADGRGER